MLFSNLLSHLICEKSFHIKQIISTNLDEIRDIELLDGTHKSYNTDVVYFGYSNILTLEPHPQQCILVETEDKPSPLKCKDYATVPSDELFAVFNASKQYIQSQRNVNFYEELLQKSHETHTLDEVLNFASIKLGKSLIVCDNQFHVVSHSTSIPVTDIVWKEIIDRGYCNYDFAQKIKEYDINNRLTSSTETYEVDMTKSGNRKCRSNIFIDGIQVGFVLMIASGNHMSKKHILMLSDVSRAISYVLKQYQPESLRHSSANQKLLEALLMGTPADILTDSIMHLNVPDAMYVLYMKPRSYISDFEISQHIFPPMQTIFPDAYIAIHENGLVLLVPDPLPFVLETNKTLMLSVMDTYHLDVAVSLFFSKMDDFNNAFHQAKAVIKWNHLIPEQLKKQITWDKRYPGEACPHRYSEIMLYELMSNLSDAESLAKYIHPGLNLLRSYDAKTGGDLTNTLKVYLENFHNNKDTSEVLGIHRNSLAYRLDKISEVGRIDFNDTTTELLLRLSFKLEEYLMIDNLT